MLPGRKMRIMGSVFCAWMAILLFVSLAAAQGQWYRGNTHTHTAFSDGDAAPSVVVRWYKEHGYNFVVITDHDRYTPIDQGDFYASNLTADFGQPGKFLVIGGEEVTDKVHLNAINVRESIKPQGGTDPVDIMNRNARAIRAAGGLPQVNHPNWHWRVNADQLIAATEVKHFELFNAGRDCNNSGGGGAPSTEEMWDRVLSSGRVLYGLASDDTHSLFGEFSMWQADPGRGWIVVKAAELSALALVAAIDRGDFYASNGVELVDYEQSDQEIRLELPPDKRHEVRYRTYFIGRDGQVLKRDDSLKPTYRFRGDELYVRARVEASNGTMAWTQPVFLGNK
jgi:hypothetical protein